MKKLMILLAFIMLTLSSFSQEQKHDSVDIKRVYNTVQMLNQEFNLLSEEHDNLNERINLSGYYQEMAAKSYNTETTVLGISVGSAIIGCALLCLSGYYEGKATELMSSGNGSYINYMEPARHARGAATFFGALSLGFSISGIICHINGNNYLKKSGEVLHTEKIYIDSEGEEPIEEDIIVERNSRSKSSKKIVFGYAY